MNRQRPKDPAREKRDQVRAKTRSALDKLAGKPAPPKKPSARAINRAATRGIAYRDTKPVNVSTARAPGTAPAKTGDMISPSLRLAIRERLACFAPGCSQPATEPHHTPTTGSNGVTIDDLCLPACRRCHDRFHTGRHKQEEAAAYLAFRVYLVRREPELLRAMMREMAG